MLMHASRLRLAGVAALFVWSMGARSDAAAQSRFELLGQDAVAAVTGLTVYTIRDRATAGCYMLFALDPAQSTVPGAAEPAITEEPTAEQLESVHVAQLLKDAIAERNRRIVDLQSHSTTMWTVQYETLRQQRQCGVCCRASIRGRRLRQDGRRVHRTKWQLPSAQPSPTATAS